MTALHDKGLLLEEGVRLIEQQILRTESRVKDSELTIETRKITIHLGVRHEIDLYIRIAGARGYDAVFIFECKNWKDKIGKNEVVVFSEKVRVSSAQRGFFVATGFTEDAVAQAAQDSRIELVRASAAELDQVVTLAYFHVLIVEYVQTTLNLFEEGASSSADPKPIDIDSASATLDSQPLDLKAYVLAWQQEAQDRRTARWGSPLQPAGEYPLETEEERTFEPGVLIIEGRPYTSAKLRVLMNARVIRPAVRARVDVDGRGVALQLEPVRVGDGEMKMWIASTDPQVDPEAV